MARPVQQNLFGETEPDESSASFLARPYITRWVDRTFTEAMEFDSGLLVAGTGTGKCLARGTPVLMHDGTIKMVEQVKVGERLMGPDSKPRKVRSLAYGCEMMYRVIPKKGDSYVVNESHILSLKLTPKSRGQRHTLINITVREYLTRNKKFKHLAKGWRCGVVFEKKPTTVEPYFLGLWIGDGESTNQNISSVDDEVISYLGEYAERLGMIVTVGRYGTRCPKCVITYPGHQRHKKNPLRKMLNELGVIRNKHIPKNYLTSNRKDRLELLAGLIDSDGSASTGCYDFTSISERIASDVLYLARSLGFAAYISSAIKACQTGAECLAYRVCISGYLDEIPVLIERKKLSPRRQKKNHLVHGIKVEPVGYGEYFGFNISGDGLFLLGDFTVTHNTPYAGMFFKRVLAGELDWKYPGRRKRACLFIAHENELLTQAAATIAKICPGANVQIEQGSERAGGEADIVIASRDTICKERRLASFGPDAFHGVIVDECHRYGWSSSKWRAIRNHFKAFYAGVTATPDRGDGQSLQAGFETIIDYYPMLDAIQDGWLVPVHQRYEYLTDIDLDVSHRGDWTDEEIADRMGQGRPMAMMVAVMRKYGCMATRHRAARPVVGVCSSPRIAERVAEDLNAWHGKANTGAAVYLHGKQTPEERLRANEAFKGGKARYLCIYEVGLEGYDYDEIGVVVNGRMTTKRYKVEQMAGRIVRPLQEIRDALAAAADAAERRQIIAASRKPGGLFVDLTGTQLKLTMKIASLADVFAGRNLSDCGPNEQGDRVAAAKRATVAKNGQNDVAKEMAELMKEERERVRAAIDAQKAASAAKWAALGFTCKTKHIELDPFDLFDVRLLPQSVFKPGRGATSGQKKALRSLGLGPDIIRGLSRKQAKQWLTIINNRRRAGMCSYKTAAFLREKGYPANVTKAEADEFFAELKANNWKKPAAETAAA